MDDYQHILLAADFSQHGEYVARKAMDLAKHYQAKLSIIHVLDNVALSQTPYGTVIALDKQTDNDALEEEKARLKQFADKLDIDDACRWLVWGSPKQEIVETAVKENVDLIVVGSHGRHGLALLLGSTANGVLHYAQCDVMAVRLQE